MLTQDEKKFLDHWEKNKEKEKNIFNQMKLGLRLGLLIVLGIVLNFVLGWYKRANMVAFSQSTPLVLVLGFVIIIVFCSFFYNQHKWEMNDQRYQILLKRKALENTNNNKQQETASDSPIV